MSLELESARHERITIHDATLGSRHGHSEEIRNQARRGPTVPHLRTDTAIGSRGLTKRAKTGAQEATLVT
jgi:hypothetical protein